MRLMPSGKSSFLLITGLLMTLFVYKFAISAGPAMVSTYRTQHCRWSRYFMVALRVTVYRHYRIPN